MKHFFKILLLVLCGTFFGCMQFTQKDYDLQKKKYEREQQAQEEQAQDTVRIKW